MFAGKPAVFEAITVHGDDIAELPEGTVALAANDMGLQALELRHGAGIFWGVQYHPEYGFDEIAACAVRYRDKLIEEGLFAAPDELEGFVMDLRALNRSPRDRRLGWKHGLGPAVQEAALKLAELRNWLEVQVLPHAQRRAPTARDRP
jgi:GMP synthase (glutamine-hydrolysing)